MNYIKTTSRFAIASTVGLCLSQPVWAVPVQGGYTDTAACDTNGAQTLTDELGDSAVFPVDESLDITVTQATFPSVNFACVADDGIANEWLVTITNVSNIAYTDLFYVADKGVTVGNADGVVEDLTLLGTADAFRIDGTVTAGVNNPLIAETGPVDEILQPGETWEFTITNLMPFAPPSFSSVGEFAASSALVATSNSSILARPVPEPASVGLFALGAAVLGARRRRA
jgi:PEP-CTERM motif